jgi:hypothetical protein
MERTQLSPSTKFTATVTAASAKILSEENRRGWLVLTNTHATNIVYLGFGEAAEVGKGVCIMPKETFKMDAAGCFSGDIYAIASDTTVVSGQSCITNN